MNDNISLAAFDKILYETIFYEGWVGPKCEKY